MVNCYFYPEVCKAKTKYSIAKTKFITDRIRNAGGEKKEMINLLKNRQKTKDWKKLYPINNFDFNYKDYTINKNNPFNK